MYRRFSAFVEKLTRAGLQFRPEDVLNLYKKDTYSLDESYQKAIQQTKDGVTAWICPADHIAYDFISVFTQYGLVVGRDYSITGFDGIPNATDQFDLTTIQIPYREVGYQAARRLHDLLDKPFQRYSARLFERQGLSGRQRWSNRSRSVASSFTL